MNNIYLESCQAIEQGAKFTINFHNRTFRIGKKYIIKNSEYQGDLGVSKCNDWQEFLSTVESLYIKYKYSIPSQYSESKKSIYFKALPESELEDEDMMFGIGRDIARLQLEFYILCQIIQGLEWGESDSKWFWQSSKDSDLIILKNIINK